MATESNLTEEQSAFGVDFSGLQAAADKACATIDELREERGRLRRALRYALDTEGGIDPDDYEYIRNVLIEERAKERGTT